ncbi:MAG: hypothetical protein ACOY5C_07070 [Pseudomonadota bacterium]
MDKQTVEVVGNVMAYYSTPMGTAPLVQNVVEGDAAASAVATLQTVGGLVEMFGKNLPLGTSVALAGASLANDGYAIRNSYTTNGTVSARDIYSAAANLNSVVSALALAGTVAGGTALSAPALVGLAALATAAGAALTVASMASQDSIDVPTLMDSMKQSFQQLADTFGESYQETVTTLSDTFTQSADFFEALMDGASQAFLEFAFSFGDSINGIEQSISDFFNRAKNWVWPRDPLLLDLDGDGLETVGLDAGAYFDHDGDGVLTRTGWAGRDDALLVWDRNADGSIDSGAELFGDFTPLPNGTLAPNGFAALAALDANGDGLLDANDPAFAELKLWRDASQDGVSQGGEFITLADAGIVSLNLASTLKNQNLANGNQLTRAGSFTRADGSTGGLGEFRLAADTFSTRFAEPIEVPEEFKSLPTLGGAGNVRELQQAAALSPELHSLLTQFQAATTRAEQQALLDQLITAWADTSGMAKSLEERASGKYRIVYEAFGNERRSSSIDTVAFAAVSSGSVGGGGTALMTDFGGMYLSDPYRKLIAAWSRKLHVLEAFNGQYFFNLPEQKSQTDGANWGLSAGSSSGGGSGIGAIAMPPVLRVEFSQQQLDLLDAVYASLKESVYASLVMQTRLKPYLDQLELVIDDQGLRPDATALNQLLAAKKAADPESYLADLLDLDRYASSFLSGANWQGLADFKVRTLSGGDDSVLLSNSADIVLAGEADKKVGAMKTMYWQGYWKCANETWRVVA